jgi:hypothetical protein
MPSTSLTGVDDYMSGLVQFAQGVVPGSADVIASMVPGSGLAADEGGHRMRLEPVYSAGI